MPFFSFSLLKDPYSYSNLQIQPKQKYYSKDIALWNELNNRNKNKEVAIINYEQRQNISSVGKKLLLCLPPKFGLGDAFEYSIAINSLKESKKFDKIGIAFCSNHSFIFNKFFSFLNTYPLLISEAEINKYDTIFHISLEIEALKFQKYKRSNISLEICNYFNVKMLDYKVNNKKKVKDFKKAISIFPVSTSFIRSLPFSIIEKIVEVFGNKYEIRIIVDDSIYSKHLIEKNTKNNFIFVKPKNIKSLILEISKINFGIFIDSGPLHIAKTYNKKGVFIETSVSSKILLTNSNDILFVKNKYKSNYCNGPCGLVDIFNYEGSIGCYETNKISFEKIKEYKSLKNLQRWNKKENNLSFISNPVGCINKIDINNIIKLINIKLKE